VYELFVIDHTQPFCFQTPHLLVVVYDVAQAVQVSSFVQYFLGHLYGVNYAKAEARILINGYLKM
jgi:hypothetical protein